MNDVNRRDLCFSLAALAALPTIAAHGQGPGQPSLSASRTFAFDQLPATHGANGFVSHPVTRGVLTTGETVEVHESTLQPGQMPHQPHRHRHSEFMMIREGQLEFNNDGTPERVGPGGIIFAASNVMHGLKNIGDTPANYFVVGISADTPIKNV